MPQRGKDGSRSRHRLSRQISRLAGIERGVAMNLPGKLLLSVLFSLAANAGGTQPVLAQSPDNATAATHYERGERAYTLGRFSEAIKEFEAAYEIQPDPILLFNIAQSHRNDNNLQRARFFYQRYLERAPNAENRTEIERRIKELEARLESEKAHAEPMNLSAPTPVERVGDNEAAAPPTASPPVAEVQPIPAQAAVGQHGWWLGRKWTWVAASSALLLAAGATTFGLLARSKFNELKRSCGSVSNAQIGCSESEISSVNTRQVTANLLWGAAGVAAATAGLLFYLEGRSVAVAPMAGRTTGVLARVEF